MLGQSTASLGQVPRDAPVGVSSPIPGTEQEPCLKGESSQDKDCALGYKQS